MKTLDSPVETGAPRNPRIPALDFTKGALVLIMVLYHWINYFISPGWKYLFYLRFLTPSFIFITGFMISHVYLSKYATTDSQLSKRLIVRGMKLFAIFFVLNFARELIVPVLGTGIAVDRMMISPQVLVDFFASGNLPDYGPKLVSFPILVSISYLLLIAGVLIPLYRRYRYTFHVACISLFLASVIFGYADARNYQIESVAIGMLGVLTGFLPIRTIDNLGRRSYLLAFTYIGYLVAITIWNVPFLLLIIAVLLNLCILYLLGTRASTNSSIRNEVILLGKYSLVGYISQVAILQILSKGYQRLDLGAAKLPSSLFAAVVFTVLAVKMVDLARARSSEADRLYKMIFA